MVVRRGPALHTAEHVTQQWGAEYDVLDSRNEWIGTAVATEAGACFLRPPELKGLRVLPPFQVNAQPNSARLATALGAALSRALLSPG